MKKGLLISLIIVILMFKSQCILAREAQIDFVENGMSTQQLHSGSFGANAVISGCSGEEFYFMIAVYSENELIDIQCEKFEAANDEFTFESAPACIEKDMLVPSVKAFLWDKSLKPLKMAQAPVYCNTDGHPVSMEVLDALKRFEDICTKDVLVWLASLYDPESGGFYYSGSARDYEGFLPDLESTSQALTIMRESGIIPHGTLEDGDFPAEIRVKIGSFAQGLQSDDDGYFYHPQWGSNISISRRERDLSWAKNILSTCGVPAMYAYPEQRISAADISLMSETEDNADSFTEYLNSLDFSTGEKAYASANELTSAINTIRSAGHLQQTIDFLKSKQDPVTGLWGASGELSRHAVNAAMKASSYFSQSTGEPYPDFDKMVDSVIYVVTYEKSSTASGLWNPAVLWQNAVKSLDDSVDNGTSLAKIEEFLPTLINSICDEAPDYKKSDGGFSYYKEKSIGTSQGSKISLGLAEGDVNATLLCTERIRQSCYALAGVEYDSYFEKYRDEFFALLKSAQTSDKLPIAGDSFEENFDSMSRDVAAENWSITGAGTALVKAYPATESNCICVENNGSGYIKAKRPLFLTEDYDSLTYEFDLCLANSTDAEKYERWSIYLGEYAAEFIADGRAGDGYQLYWRTTKTASGSLGTPVYTLNAGVSYKLKMVYSTSNADGEAVKLYIDDTLVFTTGEHYNMSAAADVKIENISFYGWSDTNGKLYADNIKLQAIQGAQQ